MHFCFSPQDVVARRMEPEVEERFRICKSRPFPVPPYDADLDNDNAPYH